MENTIALANKTLSLLSPDIILDQATLGLEGFIDMIWSGVRIRYSETEYELMESMTEWAQKINNAVGSGADVERILKKSAPGGFSGNVGKALSTLCGRAGNVHLIGLYGMPNIKQILRDTLIDEYHCVLNSMGNPGETDAYEFADGKIMMVAMGDVNRFNWDQIVNTVGVDLLRNEFDAGKVWGIGYWSALPHMSEIFTKLQGEVFPSLTQSTSNKHLVLDLADLRKRPADQLPELINLLPRFEDHVKTALLLNNRELELLGKALGGDIDDGKLALTRLIQKELNLTLVFSHSAESVRLVTANEEIEALNAFTSTPRFTTSAGDHFTAGVCYGLLADLPYDTLPMVGNCTSSYFIRSGKSPTSKDIMGFLTNYSAYFNGDVPDIIEQSSYN